MFSIEVSFQESSGLLIQAVAINCIAFVVMWCEEWRNTADSRRVARVVALSYKSIPLCGEWRGGTVPFALPVVRVH
ncbi:MAG: hypothetical protein PUF51_01635 [Bifidobacteriaceae bacterium]|nr:hypothetical protein [Bifidobacteriaceae bacterium]